jgi:heat shock protein HslJ
MKITKLLSLLLVFACTLSVAFAQSAKGYSDGNWKIKSLKESGKLVDVSSKETSITINNKDESIAIFVGCNRLTSKLEFITGDRIKPFQFTTANKKKCTAESQELESTTRYALEQTNSIRKQGARIEFYKDTELLIVLERPVAKKK